MKKSKMALMLLLGLSTCVVACNNSSSTSDNSSLTSNSESSFDNATSSLESSSSSDISSGAESISESSSSLSEEDELTTYKNKALSEIDYTFNELDKDDYSSVSWKIVLEYLSNGKIAIAHCDSISMVDSIKNETINNILSVTKIKDALINTPFRHKTGDYELDVSKDGIVSIYYNGWPGDWTYVGNTNYNNTSYDDLNHNLSTQNQYKMTLKNSGTSSMYFQLALSNDNNYKVDSSIITIEAGETKEIVLDLTQTVKYLYMFVDSCYVETYFPRHDKSGQLDILSYGFDYVDSDSIKYESNKATILPSEKIDLDTTYSYSIAKVKDYISISKIKVVLNIDFNGADASSCYWGGIAQCGSTTYDFSSAGYVDNVDIDNNNVNESTTQTFYIEPKDITSSSLLSIKLTYWGKTYDVIVQEVSFYYGTGFDTTTETINVNKTIYENGTSSVASIPYSSFEKKGTVNKILVNLTISNNQSYVGGTVYMGGVNYCSSNLANIGYLQDSGETTTGDLVIYPNESIDLTMDNGEFTITSWWAPASKIVVNSITLVTDVEIVPDSVTNVIAHASNSQVTLEWTASNGATSYDVYCNNQFVQNVKTNYAIIDELNNDVEYSFYVVSKNSAGSAKESNIVKCTPDSSAAYDITLDGLNSDLERQIGATNIKSMKEASIVSKNNNYRLKQAFAKMKNGTNTTVGFIGGSVTVGEVTSNKTSEGYPKGYAAYTADYIKNTFGVSNNVKYVNAAISGTGSEIGIVRVQKDLLDHNPDVIFIEFAVNNSTNSFDKESYESLVRKCLKQENNPAVILVFSGNDYSGHKVEEYMTQIGTYYNLPMFSMDKALKSVCSVDSNGNLTTSDSIFDNFIHDGTHPNDDGHKLYGKLLSNFLKEIDNDIIDEEYKMKDTPLISDKFDDLVMIDNTSSIVSNGSWEKTNTNANPFTFSHVDAFTNGWSKKESDSNDALTLQVDAKNFIVVYKCENPSVNHDAGVIIIKYTNVNDPSYSGTITWDLTKSYKSPNQTGWENPISILVFDKEEVGTYSIEITLENSQTNGTIYAMGYSNK